MKNFCNRINFAAYIKAKEIKERLIKMTKKILMAAVLVMAVMIGALQNNVEAAKADISFELTNVVLSDGKCDIEGFFYNGGNTDVKVNEVAFNGTLKDLRGNVMYSIDFAIDAMAENLVVPAKEKIPASFTLTSEEVKSFNGEFHANLDYKITFE